MISNLGKIFQLFENREWGKLQGGGQFNSDANPPCNCFVHRYVSIITF